LPPLKPEPPGPGRGRRVVPLLAVCIVAAAAAAIALDAWSAAEKRRQSPFGPVDPASLRAPDLTSWRGRAFPVGGPAPGFSLPDVRTGARVRLDQLRGRPVVLLLSSFGCNVFCNELGALTDLHRRYADEAVFLFIAIRDAGHPDPKTSPPVGAPRPGESAAETRFRLVREGAEYLGLPFPALLDEDGEIEAAYDAFPKRLVIVGADGRVIYDGGRGAAGGPSAWNLEEVEIHIRKGHPRADGPPLRNRPGIAPRGSG
jgi:AhpC/TSA family